MQEKQSPRSRFGFIMLMMVALFWIQFQMLKRSQEQAKQAQAAEAAQAVPGPSAAKPTTADGPGVAKLKVAGAEADAAAKKIFPAPMAANLLLFDPIWAELPPAEQISAMRIRAENVGKDAQAQGQLALTIGFVYEQRLNDKAAAAAEYDKLNRWVMDPNKRYEFAGQGLLHSAALHAELAKSGGDAKANNKAAHTALNALVTAEQKGKGSLKLWGKPGEPGVPQVKPQDASGLVEATDAYRLALWRIDELSRTSIGYRVLDWLVGVCGGKPGTSHVVALLLLALVLNVITFPLSRMSYRSMREMQRIAPLQKEIQTKYKADPQRMQAETMKIYKEHGVNPMAGCLPMLIQMPVFIFVYQGIRAYTFHFHGASFLWIKSLAEPDLPLLLAYSVSMFVTQRLMMSAQPAMDPQQAQMQKTMSWMMPLMFTFMMYSWRLPSAFYFYWLAFNVFSTTATLINRRTLPESKTPVVALSTAPSSPDHSAAAVPTKDRRATGAKGQVGRAKGKKKGGKR